MRILITGGMGFIGSNLIKYLLQTTDIYIVNLDLLTYAGNPDNLIDLINLENYTFIHGSINDAALVNDILERYEIEGIINCAAESHVDRSIVSASRFIDTNVCGTLVLLEAAKKYMIKKFLQMSTDEVYGTVRDGMKFTETSSILPNSPYAASKASADCLVRSFIHTYDFPAVITRCSNNYGPNQFPEKFIPVVILNALQNNPIPIYGDGLQIRDWIHVEDHCKAVWKVFTDGKNGEVYNIGASNEISNIDLARMILSNIEKPTSLITHVKDRLGHDFHYAIDSTKIRNELGWTPLIEFEVGLHSTIKWYSENLNWVEPLLTKANNY